MFSVIFMSLFGFALARGGVKCTTCPSCMVCDPLVGCVYDNFASCSSNKIKGYCTNGFCDTSIGNLTLPKLPVCKTYKLTKVVTNTTTKISKRIVNDINGLSCTKPGALFESACIKGECTPYTLAIDKLGQPTGCQGLANGFMCDTNGVFTDGEMCVGGKCVMPDNPYLLCKM